MKNCEFVTNWVIEQVKEKYTDDIALVVSHTTLRMDEDVDAVSYFVPITGKGHELGRTFILNGEGFDIWGIPWERLEGFAELEEYNITVLADAKVLYARSDEELERFESLQNKLRKNLNDSEKMYMCALQAYAQAKSIYMQMLFGKGSEVKLGAGYVLDYLAQAIAFMNCRYFKKTQTNQLEELETMDRVPEGFTEKYIQVIKECNGETQKVLCYELICSVQEFLESCSKNGQTKEIQKEKNYQDLADWYGELSYTWLRIRYYASKQDYIKVYMWGIYLQHELNQVCEDFGLENQDLMDYYEADNLERIVKQADSIEVKMRQAIEAGGGKIHEYATAEEFLDEV